MTAAAWVRPPAGIGGTWYPMPDRRGRQHVVGKSVLPEFLDDGQPIASGAFDFIMNLARTYNRAVPAKGGAA